MASVVADVAELQADIEELRALQPLANRKRTVEALDAALEDATRLLEAAGPEEDAGGAAAPDEKDGADAPPAASEPPPPAPPAPEPLARAAATPKLPPGLAYAAIPTFGWDAGEYNTPWVSVYVTLEGVGAVKDQVQCDFAKDGFDLKVHGLAGKNYRLVKDNLEKDVVPEESKIVVRKDRVTIKLKKVKGEFSYDSWTALTSKKKKAEKKKGQDDPMGGIMDLMKDMYQDGDDNMKKIIAESMMKAQAGGRGGAGGGGDASSADLGGLGGLGDF